MRDWQALVVSAQGGDLAAFEQIVRRFRDMAVGYAYSLLGDFPPAQDAAQEVLIEAYCKLGMLREPRAFPAWLRRIVFQQCDRLTRGKRPPLQSLEATGDVADRRQGPLAALEQQELHDAVLAAHGALPEHERTTTTLFYIDGYSVAEIGEFLEVPVGTVKSRLHSARQRLRERMTAVVEDGLKQHAPGDEFAQKVRQVLENVPWIGWSHGGPRPPEETMFPACLRAFLEYVGEASDLQGPPGEGHPWHNVYINLMGISGAAFRVAWDDHWQSGNPDMIYMAADPAEPIRRAFRAVGHGCEIVMKPAYAQRIRFQGEPCDDEAAYRRCIVESLRDRRRPLIGFGVVGPPECCLITGYDGHDDALLGWSYFQSEFLARDPDLEIAPSGYYRKRHWYKGTHGLILIGERQERPPLRQACREALPWALQVMRTPRIHGRHSGLAAYGPWAEALLRDEDWPMEDPAILHHHLMEHNLTSVTVAEGRYWGAHFLRWVAAAEPAASQELSAAADRCQAQTDLMWAVWGVVRADSAPGYADEDARILAQPEIRRQIAPLIRQARDQDAAAADHIERAIGQLR